MKSTDERFETIGQWHDYWAVVLLRAPNEFRDYDAKKGCMVPAKDQTEALEIAYATLKSGLHFAERKIKDDGLARVVRELIEMAFEAYRIGDRKRGNHTLQEAEGMIWTGSKMPVKYAVEAERRAFGQLVRFKDVRVSQYPIEGGKSDLGEAQSVLLQSAEDHCSLYLAAKESFKFFGWVYRDDETVERIDAPSRKKLQKYFEEQALHGSIVGAAIAEIVISGESGLIVYELHERARPRVKAIAQLEGWRYERLRYHLEDPTIFPSTGH